MRHILITEYIFICVLSNSAVAGKNIRVSGTFFVALTQKDPQYGYCETTVIFYKNGSNTPAPRIQPRKLVKFGKWIVTAHPIQFIPKHLCF